jgi:hypothetical protein
MMTPSHVTYMTIRFWNNRRTALNIVYLNRDGTEGERSWIVEEGQTSGGIITYHNNMWRITTGLGTSRVWTEDFRIDRAYGMNQRIYVDDHGMGEYP